MSDLVERLRFHGRFGNETEEQMALRKRNEREEAAAELIRLRESRDAFKQTLHDELDENLRLRELGGARPDEGMTAFLERVFAELSQLRAERAKAEPVAHLPVDSLAALERGETAVVFPKEAPPHRLGWNGTMPLYATPPAPAQPEAER